MINKIFQCAVLFEKSYAFFLAYSRYTRNIIGAVSHQAFKIDKLFRCKIIPFTHGIDIVKVELAHATFIDQNIYMRPYKLEFVLIPRYYKRIYPVILSSCGYCTDNVISFILRYLQYRNIHGVKNIVKQWYL